MAWTKCDLCGRKVKNLWILSGSILGGCSVCRKCKEGIDKPYLQYIRDRFESGSDLLDGAMSPATFHDLEKEHARNKQPDLFKEV